MSIFQDVTLSWGGRQYLIPANRIMKAIACVEEHITLQELVAYSQRQTAPLSKLSSAFGAVLRYAGATITDEEVYSGVFNGGENASLIVSGIETLLMLMVPPRSLENSPSGKPPAAAVASLKKRTRQR